MVDGFGRMVIGLMVIGGVMDLVEWIFVEWLLDWLDFWLDFWLTMLFEKIKKK